MEWCSHCFRFRQTTVENIIDEFSGKYCSSCTVCGKVLLGLNGTPFNVLPPKKRIKKNSRRIKKGRNANAKFVKKECDSASEDPLVKEEKHPINSDTSLITVEA